MRKACQTFSLEIRLRCTATAQFRDNHALKGHKSSGKISKNWRVFFKREKLRLSDVIARQLEDATRSGGLSLYSLTAHVVWTWWPPHNERAIEFTELLIVFSSKFTLVLITSYSLVIFLYLLFSATCYGAFGDGTLSPILSNLKNGFVRVSSTLALLVNLLITYAILLKVPETSAEVRSHQSLAFNAHQKRWSSTLNGRRRFTVFFGMLKNVPRMNEFPR